MKFNFQKAEEIYVPTQPETRLEIFIRNNFEIPDNNLNKIVSFINSVNNLETALYDLPQIISSEFPNDRLQLTLYRDEWDEDPYLSILIFSSFDGNISALKENELYTILIDQYESNIVDAILFEMVYQYD